MKKETKRRIQIAATFLFDALAISIALFGISGFFLPMEEAGFMATEGVQCFQYFTVDSNLFMAVTCFLHLPFLILLFLNPKKRIPEWVSLLHFLGNASTMVTFLTVCFFLGPTQGFGLMYVGTSFYLHALAPIFALIAYLISPRRMRFSFAFMGVIPVLIYGAVYLVMVVLVGPANGGWNDFYGFNVNNMWPLTFLVMILLSLLLSYLLFFLRKIVSFLPFVEE